MSTDNGSIDAAIARLSSSEFIEPLCCDDFDPKYIPSLCGAFEQWLSERREHVAEALDGKGFPDDGSRDVEVFGAIPDAYDFLFSPDFERERGYARMAAVPLNHQIATVAWMSPLPATRSLITRVDASTPCALPPAGGSV